WAERTGHVPQGFLNPARGVRQFPSRPRDRWIQPDEWPGLFEALEEEESLYAKAAVLMLIFTGCRLSEVLGSRWENVDFQRRELTLPMTKSGNSRIVPLSEPAIEILQNLPRTQGNPFIICGERRGCHMVNLGKPWRRIRQRAGLPDLKLHDIRRSYGSILASEGVAMQTIQRLLGHSNVTVTSKVYAHLSPDTLADGTKQLGTKVVQFSKFKRKTQKEAQ
ncbi:MAG TPA: site-specific integrase, partial [bacterium]|nr:site-specific integrase [bacterium]